MGNESSLLKKRIPSIFRVKTTFIPNKMASEAAASESAEPSYNGASSHNSKVEKLDDSLLSEDEEEAVALFMGHVNSWRQARSFAPLSRESSVKFLMARKFTVDRAIGLYRQHELMRLREKLFTINPNESPLQEEIIAGKFTVLGTRDSHGAALALFNAHLHDPTKALHGTTLQNVVYQLDVALENPENLNTPQRLLSS